MQVGAYVVWSMDRTPGSVIPPGQNVVLCVGDSWTHGMGSSDSSKHGYPAVLQGLLRERTAREWLVVNGGQSGQNSRDVLQRLPSQLTEFRPRVVCVLVGLNDFWSVPDELTEGSESSTIDHGAYRFRWRIPRLVAWIYGKFLGSGQVAAKPSAPRDPEWAPRKVEVEFPYRQEPMKWKSTESSHAHQQEGWKLNAANNVHGALLEFELALAAAPDDAQTRQMLVELYRKSGRNEEATTHLQWLIESWTRDLDFWSGRSLVAALNTYGRSQEALDVAVKLLTRFPKDGTTWLRRAQSEFFLGRHADAKRSIEEAIRLAPDRWAYFWLYKIHFLGLRDVDEGIRSIYRAYVALNDADRAADDLRALMTSSDGSRLRPVLESFGCESGVRTRLSQIVDEVLASRDGAAASRVLSAHLRRIAALARDAGATPVFLSYPVKQPAEAVLRAIAAELDVKFVDVSQIFGQRLAPRRWDDVRAPDGHCNDEGYRMMADIVADGLQSVVGATGR